LADPRIFPAGVRVDDLDLSDLRLHGTNLEGARMTETYLVGASITGDIEGLRVNGVEIEPLVRAELERRNPELVLLRAADLGTLREAWSMLERLWSGTTARAMRLREDRLTERVDGEWSFLETLRHLVFATDCWVARGIHGVPRPYHAWGLPWSGVGPEWAREVGVDLDARPTPSEVLQMREDSQASVRRTLDTLTDVTLQEVHLAPDDGGHPSGEHSVLQCLHVLFNEEWHHRRYATRDLDILDPDGSDQGITPGR
jgi:DinB superfamily